MRILTVTILFILSHSLSAQRKAIDSLLAIIDPDRNDTALVKHYISLANSYTIIKPDSNIYYSKKAIELSKKLDYKNGEADAYQKLSSGYKIKGDYPMALEHLQYAKQLYIQLKNEAKVRFMEFAEGTLNHEQKDYAGAFEIFQRLKPFYEDPENRISKEEPPFIYTYLASTYANLNQPDSAIHYAWKIIDFIRDKKDLNIAWPYSILGDAYFQKDNLDSSLKYYKQSNFISALHSVPQPSTTIGIAKVFLRIGNIDSCIWYARTAYAMSQESKRRVEIIKASLFLAEVYEKIDPSKSLQFYKLGHLMKDTVYDQQKIRDVQNLKFTEEIRKREAEEKARQNKARLQRYLLIGGIASFALIALVLVRSNKLQQNAKHRIEKAYADLKNAQAQLVQREKMASLGELTAGIAHEIQNPLNFVNNFSEVNKELIGEMKSELLSGNKEEAVAIANDLEQNLEKINHHGKRADAIVKGMLQHSRASTGKKELTNINALAEEYLKLSYHGLRAKDQSFNAQFKTNFDETITSINAVPQDIGRVLLNLFNNAFYAVTEKKKQQPGGYDPMVTVSTKRLENKVELKIADNGNGISQNIVDKIFQPFFTTKPTGEGTGLGLSLSYDIIKSHRGDLKVQSEEGKGAEFLIQLPI